MRKKLAVMKLGPRETAGFMCRPLIMQTHANFEPGSCKHLVITTCGCCCEGRGEGNRGERGRKRREGEVEEGSGRRMRLGKGGAGGDGTVPRGRFYEIRQALHVVFIFAHADEERWLHSRDINLVSRRGKSRMFS